MKLDNRKIILTAQAIQGCGYPVERDLDAVVELLTHFELQIDFSRPDGHHTQNVVAEVLNDLEVQRCAIYVEREAQEAREAEFDYELEPEGEEE